MARTRSDLAGVMRATQANLRRARSVYAAVVSSRLIRIALAVVALLVLGWNAVLLRNFESSKDVAPQAFSTQGKPAAPDPEAFEKLRDARTLDPDTTFDLALSGYYLVIGQDRRAIEAAEAVTRREPENIAAWLTLQAAANGSDPALAARARARLKALDPRGSGR